MPAEHHEAAAVREPARLPPQATEVADSPANDLPALPTPALPPLLANPNFQRRGNEPVRQAAILQLQRAYGNRATQRLLQRRQTTAPAPVQRDPTPAAPAAGISDKEADQAIAWAQKENLGREAIVELQTKLGVTVSGTYDHETAAAVYDKQREWQKKGKLAQAGQASKGFFERLGLIFTHEIKNATVGSDAASKITLLKQIKADNPNGITVAIYVAYGPKVQGQAEFPSQAGTFATNQKAIGLNGGAIAIGKAVSVKELAQVVEAVQSIHRGLLADAATVADPADAPDAGGTPRWTQIKNLALFAHGEAWGMGLDEGNTFKSGGLHQDVDKAHPSNIKAFVKGMLAALAPEVDVQLFACLTGHDTGRTDYEEWTGHKQGERAGEHSLASELTQELGADASVFAHTTAGHTTENFAARVFGKAAGGGTDGLHMFDLMYPETFVQAELQRLYPDKDDEQRADLHDSLREQMWAHYKDSILAEHKRKASAKRYAVPMGQEMFVNPDNARTLIQADWTTWITKNLKNVKPKAKPKAKK